MPPQTTHTHRDLDNLYLIFYLWKTFIIVYIASVILILIKSVLLNAKVFNKVALFLFDLLQ